jgi:hypothetical protein
VSRRRSPERWQPPLARRTRDAKAWAALGLAGPPTWYILKSIWHGDTVAPPWAETAYRFGWITSAEHYAAWEADPHHDPRGRIPELLYRDSPFFGLIAKDTSWDEAAS